MEVEDFIRKEISEDFNTRTLFDKLNCFEQKTLILLMEKYKKKFIIDKLSADMTKCLICKNLI